MHRLPISQSDHTGEVADLSIAMASVLHGCALDIPPASLLGLCVIVLLLVGALVVSTITKKSASRLPVSKGVWGVGTM